MEETMFYLVAVEPLPTCFGKFASFHDADAVRASMKTVECEVIQPELPLKEHWTPERRRQLFIALTQPSSEELLTQDENKGTTEEELFEALAKHAGKYEPKAKKKKERAPKPAPANDDGTPKAKRVVQKGAVAKVIEVFDAAPFRWDDPECKAKAKAAFEKCVAAGVNKSTAAGNIRRLARKLQSEQDMARDIDASLKQS